MIPIVLTCLMVLLAVLASLERRAQHSLGLTFLSGLLLSARIAVDDPMLGAAVMLSLAVLVPVGFLHLRRHEEIRQERLSPLLLLLGAGIAVLVFVTTGPDAAAATRQIPQPSSSSITGIVVLICAVALLIGTALAVRIRLGRRQ